MANSGGMTSGEKIVTCSALNGNTSINSLPAISIKPSLSIAMNVSSRDVSKSSIALILLMSANENEIVSSVESLEMTSLSVNI